MAVNLFSQSLEFSDRHIGPSDADIQDMLKTVGADSLDEFTAKVVPEKIQSRSHLNLPEALSESGALNLLKSILSKNQIYKSYLGLGYHGTIVPPVIQRNILENPGWYTQYTPYQPEISQGRLEALLNFQTMISDLTGLPIANASLLDEATAAAEAMHLAYHFHDGKRGKFFISSGCLPQTIEVIETRAKPLGIEVVIGHYHEAVLDESYFGILYQYPGKTGIIRDVSDHIKTCQAKGIITVVAADILSLVLLKSPEEMGADIALGSTQRFGVPMGFGGPHAAYFACKEEFKRLVPGRIVGVSKDAMGRPAIRLALQTREQHIRRERATSNICTAQVLLAVMAGMYAVYHGSQGLKKIASRVHGLTCALAHLLKEGGLNLKEGCFFDTLTVDVGEQKNSVLERAADRKINLRQVDEHRLAVSLDECTTPDDVVELAWVFLGKNGITAPEILKHVQSVIPGALIRKKQFLTGKVFHSYHSETELLRYIRRLESRDLSLTHSMIPLGSCTMKLNAASEMYPVTWPEVAGIHPFVPKEQVQGYLKMFSDLEKWLCEMTGFDAFSLQPNAGSQGEFAGLLTIRDYHLSRGDNNRTVCLIPRSAHGTNPASAVMAGMKVVVVKCDDNGNVDLNDLRTLASQHKNELSALMITYPSTHGVFEEDIREICEAVHQNGGLVYMDGANFNAQIGLCRPAEFGPDVCHLNLHKTFCIPHGGGGPGMGPIGVKAFLKSFLPGHKLTGSNSGHSSGAVSAAPWGSAAILPISWMYIAMMGAAGLKKASQVAMLNANYVAKKLDPHFPVVYRGKNGLVAHECIVNVGEFKKVGITVEDVAKRLMDYGFHSPTMSWPVPGTLMIEPTESESREELDRFCDAMIAIRQEIKEVESGKIPAEKSVLRGAPHTAEFATKTAWDLPYSRERAVFPKDWVKTRKFWPAVARVDNAFGDRNLVCSCGPLEDYL